jgi:predicted type IV restriction endonuclease
MSKKNLADLLSAFKKIDSDAQLRKNESQIANSLILPFFQNILGWDVNDPEEFRSEEQILGLRADYVACINGISKFIIECKSLSHQIIGNIEFYKQAIQYADSKGKRYAVLTNFREFVILRSDIKPKNNNWLTLEVSNIHIDNIEKDLGDLIYFHKNTWVKDENLLKNLDQKINLDKRKSVDERLLSNFIKWRSLCISWLKKYKKNLFEQYDILYIEEEIQRFLDRIIFISYCEDKGLEDIRLKQYIPQFD